jgi:UDP-glucose 4-epimerase
MKILVTGGAGFVGSIVAYELIQAGAEIVVIDNLQFGHREAVHPNAVFVEGDLANALLLEELFARHHFDAVMHFAANTLISDSLERPLSYIGDNLVNAVNLLRSSVDHGVRKFVFSSTADLFSQPKQIPIAESEQIIPGSPYGESKFIVERMLHWADRIYGMRYAALRYFNAGGAHPNGTVGEDHKPEWHLVPRILEVALKQREHVEIFGGDYPTPDGTCVRDFVHVVDLAQAHILALGALERGSRAYNLGNGKGYSVKQVVQIAREITGEPIPAVIGPRRPTDPATLIASSEKIKAELGWKPRYSDLESIMRTAWQWHKVHPKGYCE